MIKGVQLIINTPASLELASKALLGGIDTIQFRHKGSYTREVYALVCELAEMCRGFSVPLIINDRVDIALSIDAAGVHLGQTDLPIIKARHLLGNRIIGATASNLEQAKRAEREGADYIGLGHIYPTSSKIKTGPPLGLALLEQVCREVKIPLLAVGGINEHNVENVSKTGVAGIAVISAISSAADPLSETEKFRRIFYGLK